MKCAALCVLLLFVAVELDAATASQKGQIPFSVTTRLDRTAIWVGDSLEYTIQVIHPRSVQFVVDDLKKENLSLPPFVLRSIRAEERDWRDDKKLFEVVLLLTTYESGKSELVVPPVALYYFRRDGTVSEKEARAQAIRIPPQKIALRSTLPGGTGQVEGVQADPSRGSDLCNRSPGFGFDRHGVRRFARGVPVMARRSSR